MKRSVKPVSTLARALPAVTPTAGSKGSAEKALRARPKSISLLSRFPTGHQTVIKWGTPALEVLLIALVLAAIVGAPRTTTAVAHQHPLPPPGAVHNGTVPPGWSQAATWTVALADQSTSYTDPDTGVTAALTPDDRTTIQTAHNTQPDIARHKANYLSVIDTDGSTRFTEPLTTTPLYGPVITSVDGAKVVLLQESSSTVTYWPLTGGDATNVNLPEGVAGQLNTTGLSVMVPLSDQRVAYLHQGVFQTVEELPLTTPMFALDGSVISVQPETGAWWLQRIDASPISIRPTKPVGAEQINQILAITPQHAIISWKTSNRRGTYSVSNVIGAYDVTTGQLIAQATTENTLTVSHAVYYSAQRGLTAANGVVLSTQRGKPAKLTLIGGLQVTAAYDVVYGQDQGQPAIVDAEGTAWELPPGTLVPSGIARDHLLVASENQLYALPSYPSRSAAALPTITPAGALNAPAIEPKTAAGVLPKADTKTRATTTTTAEPVRPANRNTTTAPTITAGVRPKPKATTTTTAKPAAKPKTGAPRTAPTPKTAPKSP